MFIFLLIIFFLFVLLFLYCSLVLASRVDEDMERQLNDIKGK